MILSIPKGISSGILVKGSVFNNHCFLKTKIYPALRGEEPNKNPVVQVSFLLVCMCLCRAKDK